MSDQPIIAVDFSDASTGMAVTESNHFRNEHCKTGDIRRIGILVGKRFYNTTDGGCECWPVIHWEGSYSESITHPANAVPFRETVKLPSMLCRELAPRQ